MQAVVKTPHISLKAKGHLSTFLVEALKKEFGRKLVLKNDENEESIDYFSSPLAKSLEKLKSPGECLRTYRENLGMSQAELGKKLGVSSNYVSDWEHGRRNISKDKAKILGKMFHISADNFI